MSTEENKTLVRRYVEEVLNKGNLDVMDELCTPDFVNHTAIPPFEPILENHKQWAAGSIKAFPDGHHEIKKMVAEGDMVVYHFTFTGTHTGANFGPIAPTGNPVTFDGMVMFGVRDGKLAEYWLYTQSLRMMQQMGMVLTRGE